MNDENLIYLATYILQQDMRVRMPKSILENMNMKKGKSYFKIFYDKIHNQLILRYEEQEKYVEK